MRQNFLSLKKGDFVASVQESPGRHKENSSRGVSLTCSVVDKTVWARLNQTWVFETAGFSVALLCLIATVTLFQTYNNQVVPIWPVTPNFVLSLLGNVAFASTLLGVHAAVAQLKWILYSKSSWPLTGFSIFQRARAGGIGAASLLLIAGAQYDTNQSFYFAI